MKKRFCELCELVVPKKETECRLCGAPTIAMTAEETAAMLAEGIPVAPKRKAS